MKTCSSLVPTSRRTDSRGRPEDPAPPLVDLAKLEQLADLVADVFRGPAAIPSGLLSGVGIGNSVIRPFSRILAILPALNSVNHSLESGPTVMTIGPAPGVGTANSSTVAPGAHLLSGAASPTAVADVTVSAAMTQAISNTAVLRIIAPQSAACTISRARSSPRG